MKKKTAAVKPVILAPMSCHPTYTKHADDIRSTLHNTDEYVIRGSDTTPEHTLSTWLNTGPAPFVGDPLKVEWYYTWRAAVDSLGRGVAGDVILHVVDVEA